MSQKGSKGGAPSRTEEAEIGSLGKLREGLPEIGIHSFKDWDTIIIPKLEDKLKANYPKANYPAMERRI
jgi:hypothetical protein